MNNLQEIERDFPQQQKMQELLQQALQQAKHLGASAAEAEISVEEGFSASVRMGGVETVEYNRDKGFSITVYFAKQKGSASTTDTALESVRQIVQAACDIAKYTQPDEYAGLADATLMAKYFPELDLYYPWNLTVEQAIDLALECENTARKLDKRITNSEGALVSTHKGMHMYGNSLGFMGTRFATSHSLNCTLIAEYNQEMERDYAYTISCDPAELTAQDKLAAEAVERTVKRLNPRKLSTRKVPVIFVAEVARGLFRHFLSAISGGNLYRKATFLLDHLHKPVFSSHIHISEKPHLLKSLHSAAFDDEGVATREKAIVQDGILQSYLLSSYSARKLGMQTTANAGGVYNLLVDYGLENLSQLLKKMQTGLLLTELMGQGVNIITGDYSRGAAGFWVENGEIQYPVSEITVAGNLKDMFKNIVAIGNDVDHRGNVKTGSVLIEEMTVAGS